MATADVSNRFPLDDVIMGCEQEAGKVGLSKHGVGHRSGVVGLLFNEELDVLEPEGMLGGVGYALVVLAWPEEKKKATPVRLLIAIFLGVVTWATVSQACMTLTWRGRTIVGEESSL